MSSLNESSEQTSPTPAVSPAALPPPPLLLLLLLLLAAVVIPDDDVDERAVTVANSHFSNTSASSGNTGCLHVYNRHAQQYMLRGSKYMLGKGEDRAPASLPRTGVCGCALRKFMKCDVQVCRFLCTSTAINSWWLVWGYLKISIWFVQIPRVTV